MRLRALAPAKVNLSLLLGGARDDGRHQLVTLFESLSLVDSVVCTVLPEGAVDSVVCPGVEGENLAARALAALRARGWGGPPLALEIDKRIPVAAGMGGGSADAAAALRLAMAVTPGRAEEVDAVAASLGADVPGQLLPGVAVGTGAGELVERFEALAEHAFVVVPSAFRLSTADVYAEADRLGLGREEGELDGLYSRLVGRVASPGGVIPDQLLVNDLEPAAVSLQPAVAAALTDVRDAGAERSMVSGSGPTVFGVFWGAEAVPRASAAAGELAATYPGTVMAEPVNAEIGSPALI